MKLLYMDIIGVLALEWGNNITIKDDKTSLLKSIIQTDPSVKIVLSSTLTVNRPGGHIHRSFAKVGIHVDVLNFPGEINGEIASNKTRLIQADLIYRLTPKSRNQITAIGIVDDSFVNVNEIKIVTRPIPIKYFRATAPPTHTGKFQRKDDSYYGLTKSMVSDILAFYQQRK